MITKRFMFVVSIIRTIVVFDEEERKNVYANTRDEAISKWSMWKRAVNDTEYQKQLMSEYDWGGPRSYLRLVSDDIYEEVTTVVYDKVATLSDKMPS